MEIEEREFRCPAGAATALADEIAVVLQHALLARGKAALAVSGGRTPRLVFERLRMLEIDWSRVTITLTDERWVPPDHSDSNERLVRSHLLVGPPARARFVPLFGGEVSPESGIDPCNVRLEVVQVPFDAVYLGMGTDGHFASLFPGDRAIDVSRGRCVAVPETAGRRARISLTAQTLLTARRVFLLFTGSDKRATYERARAPGSHQEIPLRLVLSSEDINLSVFMADSADERS